MLAAYCCFHEYLYKSILISALSWFDLQLRNHVEHWYMTSHARGRMEKWMEKWPEIHPQQDTQPWREQMSPQASSCFSVISSKVRIGRFYPWMYSKNTMEVNRNWNCLMLQSIFFHFPQRKNKDWNMRASKLRWNIFFWWTIPLSFFTWSTTL